MNLLKIHNIQKSFGGNLLLDQISLEINSDDKVALIGRNGAGKSTLIKMILGEIAPDSGDIFIYRDASIGYLSQDVITDMSHSLQDEMFLVFKEVRLLEEKIKDTLHDLEKHPTDDSLLSRYATLEEQYERLGGYEYHTFIDMILTKFGFTKEEYGRQISTFSGGEKTRVAFAKLLIMKPNILLLDEPTNHMDIEIIEWLEDYLKHYNGAVFLITHDQYFINKVVRKIYEIDDNTIESYTGNYDDYEREKVARYEIKLRQYNRQQKEIAHLQSFVDRFRYKATKAKSAQDRIKKIERIEVLDKPTNKEEHMHISFSSKRPTDAVILTLNNLSVGYEKPLFSGMNLEMRGFEKMAVIGPNGIGKTTLIKTIIHDLKPLNGKVSFEKEMSIGYFDQHQVFENSNLSLLDYLHNIYPMKSLFEVRSLLARVLFTGEDVFKTVDVLSGGEKVRLRLLLLMLEENDLLVMDEPTNHLDIDTKNIVEDIFEDYIGPMIFISHDRYFINKVASKIVYLRENQFDIFDGTYDEYKEAYTPKEAVKKEKVQREKTIRPEKEIKRLEQSITKSQEKLKELEASLFLEEVYSSKEKYKATEEEISFLKESLEESLLELLKLTD